MINEYHWSFWFESKAENYDKRIMFPGEGYHSFEDARTALRQKLNEYSVSEDDVAGYIEFHCNGIRKVQETDIKISDFFKKRYKFQK